MHMRSPPHAQLTGEPVEASDVGAFTCRGKSRNARRFKCVAYLK